MDARGVISLVEAGRTRAHPVSPSRVGHKRRVPSEPADASVASSAAEPMSLMSTRYGPGRRGSDRVRAVDGARLPRAECGEGSSSSDTKTRVGDRRAGQLAPERRPGSVRLGPPLDKGPASTIRSSYLDRCLVGSDGRRQAETAAATTGGQRWLPGSISVADVSGRKRPQPGTRRQALSSSRTRGRLSDESHWLRSEG